MALAALGAVLLVLNLAQPDPTRLYTPTTFGVTPIGYGALFELLTALDLPVERSYEVPEALPPQATVWWLGTDDVCRPPAPADDADEDAPWSGDAWIAAGGTAVVFLPAGLPDACESIAGVAVPPRTAVGGEDAEAEVTQLVRGALTRTPRALAMPALATFVERGAANVVLSIEGRPFALATPLGRGRVVVVADARFLTNQWLDGGDAAVLAADFVRAYGTPRIDERSHGLHRQRNPLPYLAGSAALPVLLGIVLFGALVVWHARLLPPALEAPPPTAPVLRTFVDSLATLYGASGDYGRIAARYQSLDRKSVV